uniref:F-box domain-containing protein n=1 Tax=Attheya septentrionalis TaxID=420275 RepID=A0A7S2UEE2_9STRA|mmetsp:Transcript_21933/g.39577  ORF Transcript_21933/g.39577 Transcript_21933/m.39577 type:complete len:452 (+) Transcript_21933:58-1413(+)
MTPKSKKSSSLQLPSVPETDAVVARGDDDDSGEDGSLLPAVFPPPFTVETKDDSGALWDLTWPIWHMLPRDERKALAIQHGCKSIGEFEELMTLRRAVGNSNGTFASAVEASRVAEARAETEFQPNPGKKHGNDNDDQDDASVSSGSSNDTDVVDRKPAAPEKPAFVVVGDSACVEELDYAEKLERGGPFLLLSDDVLLNLFSYLDVHMFAPLALVSPHWKSFTRTETVYKQLCIRSYLSQSRRKALHVGRFGGSFRNMLEQRPRVRTGGGLYVLKYSHIKKIIRDMWTDVPHGAILETVYYRYLYFQERGTRVLYALTTTSPHEMIPRFLKAKKAAAHFAPGKNEQNFKNTVEDKAVVWGRYEVQGSTLRVWATHPWHDVMMEMNFLSGDEEDYYYHGSNTETWGANFCCMRFAKHLSSKSGNFDEYYSRDLVDYKVPDEPFRFLRDQRL